MRIRAARSGQAGLGSPRAQRGMSKTSWQPSFWALRAHVLGSCGMQPRLASRTGRRALRTLAVPPQKVGGLQALHLSPGQSSGRAG